MRKRFALLSFALLPGLAACGGGSDSNESGDAPATTLSALGTTTFRTIPAESTTLSPTPEAGGDGGIIGDAPATYKIALGDIPGRVAQNLGCPDWRELATFNSLNPETFMNDVGSYPGDTINVPPSCVGAAAAEAPPAASAAPSADPATGSTDAPSGGPGSEYEVQPGDTLFDIARNFNVSMDAIVAANGWSDGIEHNLVPGKKIKLPAPPAG